MSPEINICYSMGYHNYTYIAENINILKLLKFWKVSQFQQLSMAYEGKKLTCCVLVSMQWLLHQEYHHWLHHYDPYSGCIFGHKKYSAIQPVVRSPHPLLVCISESHTGRTGSTHQCFSGYIWWQTSWHIPLRLSLGWGKVTLFPPGLTVPFLCLAWESMVQ